MGRLLSGGRHGRSPPAFTRHANAGLAASDDDARSGRLATGGLGELLEELQELLVAVVAGVGHPRRKLHIVCDNYATHKQPKVNTWLARNKRVTLHFTPTSGSWLNLVSVFFSIITRQAIVRGTFTSVPDLVPAIRRFIDGYSDRSEPFVWIKRADQILGHCKPKVTSTTEH